MDVGSEELYLSQRPLIERAITFVCRRQRLSPADADDFAGTVRLHLVEDDYAVLRGFQGRSTLRTYLQAVITHCYQDWRNARWGKWRPSAEAKRLGPVAVHLETLMVRDGLTLDQAEETLRTNFQLSVSRELLEDFAKRLPPRTGRAFVSVETLETHPIVPARADEPLQQQEAAGLARETTAVLARAVARLPAQDRLVLKMRFEDDFSIADISRALRLDQKPLYRRLEHILKGLRMALEGSGIGASAAAEVLERGGFDLLTDDARGENLGDVRPFGRSAAPTSEIRGRRD